MGRGRVCRGDSWRPLPEQRPATFHRGQTATPTRGGGPVQGQHCTEGQLTRGASRRPGPASTGRGHAVTAVTPVTGIPGCVAQQRAKVCTPCPESGRPERHPHRLLRDDPQPWQERRPATRRVLRIRQAAGLRGLRNTALGISAPEAGAPSCPAGIRATRPGRVTCCRPRPERPQVQRAQRRGLRGGSAPRVAPAPWAGTPLGPAAPLSGADRTGDSEAPATLRQAGSRVCREGNGPRRLSRRRRPASQVPGSQPGAQSPRSGPELQAAPRAPRPSREEFNSGRKCRHSGAHSFSQSAASQEKGAGRGLRGRRPCPRGLRGTAAGWRRQPRPQTL